MTNNQLSMLNNSIVANKFILVTNTKVHEDFTHPKGVKVTQVYESDDFISRAREGKTQIWIFSHK